MEKVPATRLPSGWQSDSKRNRSAKLQLRRGDFATAFLRSMRWEYLVKSCIKSLFNPLELGQMFLSLSARKALAAGGAAGRCGAVVGGLQPPARVRALCQGAHRQDPGLWESRRFLKASKL
jgi:hypothetical protein